MRSVFSFFDAQTWFPFGFHEKTMIFLGEYAISLTPKLKPFQEKKMFENDEILKQMKF